MAAERCRIVPVEPYSYARAIEEEYGNTLQQLNALGRKSPGDSPYLADSKEITSKAQKFLSFAKELQILRFFQHNELLQTHISTQDSILPLNTKAEGKSESELDQSIADVRALFAKYEGTTTLPKTPESKESFFEQSLSSSPVFKRRGVRLSTEQLELAQKKVAEISTSPLPETLAHSFSTPSRRSHSSTFSTPSTSTIGSLPSGPVALETYQAPSFPSTPTVASSPDENWLLHQAQTGLEELQQLLEQEKNKDELKKDGGNEEDLTDLAQDHVRLMHTFEKIVRLKPFLRGCPFFRTFAFQVKYFSQTETIKENLEEVITSQKKMINNFENHLSYLIEQYQNYIQLFTQIYNLKYIEKEESLQKKPEKPVPHDPKPAWQKHFSDHYAEGSSTLKAIFSGNYSFPGNIVAFLKRTFIELPILTLTYFIKPDHTKTDADKARNILINILYLLFSPEDFAVKLKSRTGKWLARLGNVALCAMAGVFVGLGLGKNFLALSQHMFKTVGLGHAGATFMHGLVSAPLVGMCIFAIVSVCCNVIPPLLSLEKKNTHDFLKDSSPTSSEMGRNYSQNATQSRQNSQTAIAPGVASKIVAQPNAKRALFSSS